MNDNSWHVLLDGDNHFGDSVNSDGIVLPRSGKNYSPSIFNKIKLEYDFDFIINSGDLTCSGYDAKPIYPFWWKKNGDVDEYGALMKDYCNKLDDLGLKYYLTVGNHDTYVQSPYFRKPVFKLVKDKYNATNKTFLWEGCKLTMNGWKHSGCYKFVKNDIVFINMGVYPKNLDWLKKQLKNINHNVPIVFIYHYTTPNNVQFSDWWTDDEKDDFFSIIKKHNVILICNGHFHSNVLYHWHGIPCVTGSGDDSCGLITFSNGKLVHYKQIKYDKYI